MRDSVENSYPHKIEIEEHSHAAMANAYAAGASGLPFAVFRGYRGVDLVKYNPNIKFIDCPFTGENFAAVPAVTTDVTVIHAQKADKKGNILIEGIIGVQKEAVLCAKKTLVTVEGVVEDLNSHQNACILPSWCVDIVSVVEGGSHPSYTHNYYPRDNKAYLEWDRISADRQEFYKWMQENVINQTPEIFATRIKNL